jgi:hypothetical protein
MHVLKRLALAALGYVASVIAGFLAVAGLYGALSQLPGAPDYFVVMALSPVLAVAAPPVGLVIIAIVIVLTVAQAIVTTLLSEVFVLRSLWIHLLFGALVAASGLLVALPLAYVGFSFGDDILPSLNVRVDLAIFALAGAIAGLVYWLIAGRQAGFTRAAGSP